MRSVCRTSLWPNPATPPSARSSTSMTHTSWAHPPTSSSGALLLLSKHVSNCSLLLIQKQSGCFLHKAMPFWHIWAVSSTSYDLHLGIVRHSAAPDA